MYLPQPEVIVCLRAINWVGLPLTHKARHTICDVMGVPRTAIGWVRETRDLRVGNARIPLLQKVEVGRMTDRAVWFDGVPVDLGLLDHGRSNVVIDITGTARMVSTTKIDNVSLDSILDEETCRRLIATRRFLHLQSLLEYLSKNDWQSESLMEIPGIGEKVASRVAEAVRKWRYY
jgi:hypothetical protein